MATVSRFSLTSICPRQTRSARFEMYNWGARNGDNEFMYRRGFWDDVFEEIPGKDNYPANLTDNAFGLYAAKWAEAGKTLNVGYYHRRYKVSTNLADIISQTKTH